MTAEQVPPLQQPLLNNQTVALRAPSQAWSCPDGSMGAGQIDGVYLSDTRIVSAFSLQVGGMKAQPISPVQHSADAVSFIAFQRAPHDHATDPQVRSVHHRTVTIDGVRESLTLESRCDSAMEATITLRLQSDLASMDSIRSGRIPPPIDIRPLADADTWLGTSASIASWSAGAVSVVLSAPAGSLKSDGAGLEVNWEVLCPAGGSVTVEWAITATDTDAVVRGSLSPVPWSVPEIVSGNDRLACWVATALDDLEALRLSLVPASVKASVPVAPGARASGQFLAAGAPWFFTLFGRDSLWTARFMLPLGTTLAANTLRALASLQGRECVTETAEQPGKIMHELRRSTLVTAERNLSLPPLYYGTIDATPLWVCVLYDAWKWGLPEAEVRALLPNMIAALTWMRDFGDADGDGLLEYVDETGTGLANQGWKDSGDSVQWRDGTLATGPIALCEVQAYAFEAAMHGADLLDHFGEDGARWREWALRLQAKFSESFWIEDPAGRYPAIALDDHKRPVDTVTSNIGHLLGTGLLTPGEAALVARRLISPELNSGFGIRTLSTDSARYWPLSYHGGSVWTHDTAIAIAGLTRDGFAAEAAVLTDGLLAAASGFGYRSPELHSGDPATVFGSPVPYPAACRPQAWSAASAVSVLASALGLRADAPGEVLGVSPGTALGALSVSGLRFNGADVAITTNALGEVTATSGATVQIE